MLTAAFAVDALRIALAVLLDTAALVIWDVGTRSPARLFSDVAAARGHARRLVRGFVRLVVGAGALFLAVAVSVPIVARPIDLTVIESVALVAALAIEQLVGPDLRSARRSRGNAQSGVDRPDVQ